MPVEDGVIELTGPSHVAGVVPWCGGGLSHWRRLTNGAWQDLLRPATPRALARHGAGALGCFPLVPYSNRIRDGRFRWAGKDVRLPLNFGDHAHSIHGHGWQAPWRIESRQDARIDLVYRHAADAWPFDYEARQSIEVTAHGLALTLSLTNHAPTPMPAGLGFHPYFAGAREARIEADVGAVWLTDDDVMPTELAGLPGHWYLPDGVPVAGMGADNVFTDWQGEASIERPDLDLRLRLRADPALGFLVVYAPPGADFFCVEPVSHITDAFNLAASGMENTGVRVLDPDQTFTAGLRIDAEVA